VYEKIVGRCVKLSSLAAGFLASAAADIASSLFTSTKANGIARGAHLRSGGLFWGELSDNVTGHIWWRE
jgi:hypothetical protein